MTDNQMTNDPMATERLRTLLTDATRAAAFDAYGMGGDADPEVVTDAVMGSVVTGATFEREVNAKGVPMRRLHVVGEWEMDPNPPEQRPDELLHTVAETYGPHPFVRQSYKGRQIDACAHFTRTSSYEASTCGAGADDPMHTN
jgi:hypothetical protein